MRISGFMPRRAEHVLLSVFVCLSFICSTQRAHSAALGPDEFGYVVTDNVPFTFEDISATGTNAISIGQDPDDGAVTVPIGFAFPFYGVNYTNASFTPNCLLTFTGANEQFGNVDFTSAAPDPDLPSVAVLWDDWIAILGSMFYQTLGNPGTRRFIVQWNQVMHVRGSADSNVTFQVVLYETSGAIKMQFADAFVDSDPNHNWSFGGSATVGIRDFGGNTNGRALQWSFNAPVITNGLALQFRPGRRIGPDAFGYTATDITPYAFEDISSSGSVALTNSDDGTTNVALGFVFNFYGSNYTNIGLSPNGLLTFGGVNSQFANVDLTTTAPTGDRPSVAVLWDDWTGSATSGAVYYQTLGPPGTHRFIAQWNQLHHSGGVLTSNVTFQVVLYERLGGLKFQYADVDFDPGVTGWSFGGGATVGIRDTSGQSNGRALQWSFNRPTLVNGQAIVFNPQPMALKIATLTNAFQVSWPVSTENWQLQYSTSLFPNGWVDDTYDAPSVITGRNVIVFPAIDFPIFFRLRPIP